MQFSPRANCLETYKQDHGKDDTENERPRSGIPPQPEEEAAAGSEKDGADGARRGFDEFAPEDRFARSKLYLRSRHSGLAEALYRIGLKLGLSEFIRRARGVRDGESEARPRPTERDLRSRK